MNNSKTLQRIPFTKMHGLGNDFIVLDTISHPLELSPSQVRQLADRKRGIGFDQLLIIAPPRRPDADFSYRIFNPDGSEVEHCGNGARCFARYVLHRGLIARSPIRVQTMNRMPRLLPCVWQAHRVPTRLPALLRVSHRCGGHCMVAPMRPR
jgi:diaminopimelate epimerase